MKEALAPDVPRKLHEVMMQEESLVPAPYLPGRSQAMIPAENAPHPLGCIHFQDPWENEILRFA
jgi:hypothetical protein